MAVMDLQLLALLLVVVTLLIWRAATRERREYGQFKRMRLTTSLRLPRSSGASYSSRSVRDPSCARFTFSVTRRRPFSRRTRRPVPAAARAPSSVSK